MKNQSEDSGIRGGIKIICAVVFSLAIVLSIVERKPEGAKAVMAPERVEMPGLSSVPERATETNGVVVVEKKPTAMFGPSSTKPATVVLEKDLPRSSRK